MKIAIVGSRNYPDLLAVRDYILSLPADTIIVSGGAIGVDRMAEMTALYRRMRTEIYYADWKTYGKSAGFIRNEAIVKASDKVVAFHFQNSKGTAHAIRLAQKYGKELEVYRV